MTEFKLSMEDLRDPMVIGRVFRCARMTRGLSQMALAARMCVQPSAVTQWENRIKGYSPTLATICSIMGALGYKVEVHITPAEGDYHAGADARARYVGGVR